MSKAPKPDAAPKTDGPKPDAASFDELIQKIEADGKKLTPGQFWKVLGRISLGTYLVVGVLVITVIGGTVALAYKLYPVLNPPPPPAASNPAASNPAPSEKAVAPAPVIR